MNKIPASVEVLTFNNNQTIERCLESISDFADVVVLDGGSSDGTLDIVRRFPVRIFPQQEGEAGPIRDFAKVRNRGLKAARHDWFLFVDSDEYFTAEVVDEIRSIVMNPDTNVFFWYVPRKHLVQGKIRDCSTTSPGLQLRFFHRGHTRGFEKAVHETVRPADAKEAIGTTRHALVAELPALPELRKKWLNYLTIEEERLRGASRRQTARRILHTLKSVLAYFFRLYRLALCRGTSMPLSYELARQGYNLKLLFILIRKLWN